MNNYKISSIAICALVLLNISCNTNESNDWQYLFNGKNLDGWAVKINHHELGDNYANTFRVKKNVIQVNYDDYQEFENRFGMLFYHQPFSSFHLKFEYRFTQQWLADAPWWTFKNSGILFHCQDPVTILKDQDFPIGIEYQLLSHDVENNPRTTGNVCTPAIHIYHNNELYTDHCLNSTSGTYEWNKWVQGEIIAYADSLIIHIVEGDTVLQYTKPHIGGQVINIFDPEVKIDSTRVTKGFIGLQAEGQGLEYRKIKIKNLK